jgi:hypothetical protein
MMLVTKAFVVCMLYERFQTLARTWLASMEPLRDPYRPERHYMRGPGPKHRAKAMAPKGGGPVGIYLGWSDRGDYARSTGRSLLD